MSEPTVRQGHSTFSLVCTVQVNTRVSATTVRRLLTDAQGFPSWNSRVARIEGDVPPERMTWTGGLSLIARYASDLKREAERAST